MLHGMSRTAVLDDQMWARIEPLLPCSDGQRGRPFREHQVVQGIVYRLRTAVPWRDLQVEFGPWQTGVWKRHNRFAKDGTWDRVLTVLHAEADAADRLDWTVSVDSTVARVHQHGATASGRFDTKRAAADVTAAAAEPVVEQLGPGDVGSAGRVTGGTSELQGFA